LASEALFRRLLFVLRERQALGLFPACSALLNVISALAVSHNFQHFLPLTSNLKPQTSNPSVDGFAVANIKNSSVTLTHLSRRLVTSKF
jgi:hypothetical protein